MRGGGGGGISDGPGESKEEKCCSIGGWACGGCSGGIKFKAFSTVPPIGLLSWVVSFPIFVITCSIVAKLLGIKIGNSYNVVVTAMYRHL